MSLAEVTPVPSSETTVPAAPPRPPVARAFGAILWRDLFVAGKDIWFVLAQVLMTPLFMLFIFTQVLTMQGIVGAGFADILLPGTVALATFTTALQSVAVPLVKEFGFTREIEDRLLSPLPTALVAVGKLMVATLRGLFAAAVVYPLGALVVGSAPGGWSALPLSLVVVLLAGWVGAALGMTLATVLPLQRIQATFSLFVTPIIWTGCVHYPWQRLAEMPWFQVATAANPMTYAAEALRAAMAPHVTHLPAGLCLLVLSGVAAAATAAALRAFARRAVR
ncbi:MULTISPECIES: ABC transporter permease [unclassified Solwaraspora]|uniref:ABC transporter permease n=1 Tax=unclassified Solwaraspora TaxID=2627926 RepID=UPI00248AAA93|nr:MULTISPECIES: ABC transporter permease [unclassified Solwaraspora]WBB99997.1 ABC transporter permease [Solwaraspora sp. WMMA2059]WBC21456.1 ABC transporter permease [Solwaraspora sp. WMMA2080]WJK36464.1 ABC transporter permease [Solwaraspora sp. WMMA2065]